jgi:hypothetical protein
MSSREALAQQGEQIRSQLQHGTYPGAGPSAGSSATHAIPGVRRLTTEVAFGAVWARPGLSVQDRRKNLCSLLSIWG